MNQANWQSELQHAQQSFDQDRLDEAYAIARRLLESRPNCAEALQVVGVVHSRRHRVDETIETLEETLRFRGDLVPAHTYLGMAYAATGELDRALRHYEQALVLDPTHVYARFNRALLLLRLARFEAGWIEYEWRWKSTGMARSAIPVPRWDGSSLDGRSILIHTEQGFGDTIQFVRFLPLLKRLGATVWFVCQKPLTPLLRDIDGLDYWMPVDQPAPIAFDVYSPLMSLPVLLRLYQREQFEVETPYLKADAKRVEKWKDRIASLPGRKIGIGWQGSPTFIDDVWRSIPLKHFATLAEMDDVTLVSLQKLDGTSQINHADVSCPLVTFDDLDEEGAFLDTIAIMQHLDLVITSDTALAHVAGAANVPVWTLISTASDWRWMTDANDTFWYDSMRLFRQTKLGDWDTVFANVAAALRKWNPSSL